MSIYNELVEIMKHLEMNFCSEKDFQVSLAMRLKEIEGTVVFCEYPSKTKVEYPPIEAKNIVNPTQFGKPVECSESIDIVVVKGNKRYPIELKYRTKEATLSKDGVEFQLKDHDALDDGSYGYLRDICRVKEFITDKENSSEKGYAIFLTNDNRYYGNDYTNSGNSYRSFWIGQGKDSNRGPQPGEDRDGVLPTVGKVNGKYRRLDLPGDIMEYGWGGWLPHDNPKNGMRYLIFEVH